MLCPVRGYGIGAATPSANSPSKGLILLFKKDQLSKAPHSTPHLFFVVIGQVCEKARALDGVDAIVFRQRPYSPVFNRVRRDGRAARTGRADQKRPART